MPSVRRDLGMFPLVLATAASQVPAGAAEQHSNGPAKSTFEHVHALAMDAEERSLYLGAHSGLYRSEDRGETWQPVGKELGRMAAVAINPKRTEEVYAASEDGKLYMGTDGGMTWTKRH